MNIRKYFTFLQVAYASQTINLLKLSVVEFIRIHTTVTIKWREQRESILNSLDFLI